MEFGFKRTSLHADCLMSLGATIWRHCRTDEEVSLRGNRMSMEGRNIWMYGMFRHHHFSLSVSGIRFILVLSHQTSCRPHRHVKYNWDMENLRFSTTEPMSLYLWSDTSYGDNFDWTFHSSYCVNHSRGISQKKTNFKDRTSCASLRFDHSGLTVRALWMQVLYCVRTQGHWWSRKLIIQKSCNRHTNTNRRSWAMRNPIVPLTMNMSDLRYFIDMISYLDILENII